MWLSCVKWEKLLYFLVLTSVLQSQAQISFAVSCRLCSLWSTIEQPGETWAAFLCFVVSPAPVLTAWNGWAKQSSSFLQRLRLGKPLVSTGTAELLGKATYPQGPSDLQALLRFSESASVILVGCPTGSLWQWHFLPSLLDPQNHPKPAAAENGRFFSVAFVKTEQILLLYKEKKLFGCWRGV